MHLERTVGVVAGDCEQEVMLIFSDNQRPLSFTGSPFVLYLDLAHLCYQARG